MTGRRRLRRAAVATAWLAAAAVLGAASAILVLHRGALSHEAVGPWRVNLLAGSPQADAYTRARVAIGGLLALRREQTMYYVATTDSAGRPLRSRCSYRVAGRPPPARWWSVTAYAEDFFLFDADGRRFGVNGETAVLGADGRFVFVTGPHPPADPAIAWVPTPGDRGLLLTLRVYQPETRLHDAPLTLDPATIEPQGACR